jgi:hypothetical protein
LLPGTTSDYDKGLPGSPELDERRSGDRRTERRLWFAVELRQQRSSAVNNIIYIVGLVVVVIAVLSFFGLR